MNDNYGQGSKYELFIGKAYGDHSRSQPGTFGTTFTNLVDSENDESSISYLGSTKKIMDNLKNYMHKAMDKYLVNKKIPESNLLEIQTFKNQIDNCNHSTQLLEIMERTDKLTEALDQGQS